MNNPEYLKCKKCGTLIRVLTKRRDGTFTYPPLIDYCPQCESKKLLKSNYTNFFESDFYLWHTLQKRYKNQIIKFSLKFMG